MSGSQEIGAFPKKLVPHSIAMFWLLRMRWVTTEKLIIAGFFASLPILTYLCHKRLKLSIHCVHLRKNTTDSAGIEQIK